MSIFERIENEILPNALMMGVDYELFWSLDPKSLSPFVKAFSLKQDLEDMRLWKQGLYNKTAVVSALNKDVKYPDKPIFSGKERKKEETPDDRKNTIKNKFLAHASLINKNKRKGK